MRGFLLTTTLLAAIAAGPAAAQLAPATTARITDPKDVVGGVPGSDYFLANYTAITKWLQTVARESDRMKLVSIGKTAEGRDQWMAIVSSPDNLRDLEHHRAIARRLALAKDLDDAQAHALARDGKAMVWIDAGIHANETVNGQAHIQIIHELLTGNDAETLRFLNDDIALFVYANPDGLELVANWYMRQADPKARKMDIPVLYQKYVGHDDNRDSFAVTQAETTNINKAMYRDWFPQLNYNQHQTGPVGTVVFIPPFRDPYNYNNEPLVINETDSLAYAMHGRLIAEGKPGSIMRSGAPYSTWFNGGLRTVGYFHNVPGILTEIIGNPTPMEIPLVPRNQLAREDLAAPIAPQTWHFQQSIDYVKTLDRAVLDYASRNRETVLYNRYVMGRDQIRKGSGDSWIVTPHRIEAVATAAQALKPAGGPAADEGGGGGEGAREIVPSSLYKTVLQDPAARAPRAYVLPADAQPDMPTTIAFLNTLIKNGVEVQRAASAFAVGGKTYPAGSFVVRTDQAFRPHVLDMFEPQDHPQDFAYPGGPPLKPYDITGYTLAYQMNVRFDRLLDGAPPALDVVPDLLAPPPGHVTGDGRAGYIVGHETNNAFRLTNRLLKAKLPVAWLKTPVEAGGRSFAPGALWIPASAASRRIVEQAVGPLGIDATAVAAAPAGERVAIRPVRIGLVDVYGGSMASGWNRWIFDQYEFPYTKVFPQELDAGRLRGKYDVLIFQSDVFGRQGRGNRAGPDPQSIPAPYRPMLGTLTDERTLPQVAAFARAGGTVIAVGDATTLGAKIGLPLVNALTTEKDGKRVPLSGTDFYIPGSILSARVDATDPLAYGVPPAADVFYYNNPVYTLPANDPSVRRVAWFDSDNPLRSGWAWGQKRLNGTSFVVDGTLGQGHVYLLGAEVTQRGQPYSTFKFLFNAALYGPASARTR